MDSQDILSQLKPLSKRTYTLDYSCFRFSGIALYEHLYSLLKGNAEKPNILKLAGQYFIQTILGIYRTDYGVLRSDYFVEGSDLLVGLISSLKLLEKHNSVIFYGYNLDDFSLPTRLYSEKRYNVIPDESLRLISGEFSLDFDPSLTVEGICALLLSKIENEYSGNFIFMRNVNMTDFHETEKGVVSSLVRHQDKNDGFFINANELIFFDSFISGENSNKNRKRGRVISMIKSNNIVSISQKTKDTPRTEASYEVCIGDGERETQEAGDLYTKDRNKDIIEALAINEKIRCSHGVSR